MEIQHANRSRIHSRWPRTKAVVHVLCALFGANMRFSRPITAAVGKICKSHKYLGALISYYTTHQTRCCMEKVFESSAGGEHEHSPLLTPTETVQTWQSNINTMYHVPSAKYLLGDNDESTIERKVWCTESELIQFIYFVRREGHETGSVNRTVTACQSLSLSEGVWVHSSACEDHRPAYNFMHQLLLGNYKRTLVCGWTKWIHNDETKNRQPQAFKNIQLSQMWNVYFKSSECVRGPTMSWHSEKN